MGGRRTGGSDRASCQARRRRGEGRSVARDSVAGVVNGSRRRVPAEAIAARVRIAADGVGYVANAQAQALAPSTTGPDRDRRPRHRRSVLLQHRSRGPAPGPRSPRPGAAGRNRPRCRRGAERRLGLRLVPHSTRSSLAGSRRRRIDPRLAQALQRYVEHGGRVVSFGRAVIPRARVVRIRNREGASQLVVSARRAQHPRLRDPRRTCRTGHRRRSGRRIPLGAGVGGAVATGRR